MEIVPLVLVYAVPSSKYCGSNNFVSSLNLFVVGFHLVPLMSRRIAHIFKIQDIVVLTQQAVLVHIM